MKFWNLLLAVGFLAVGLSLCEAALRLFHPRYQIAANPPQRIYRWSTEYRHPDTGAKHLVAYNNLGSRQHRNFHERDLAGAVNLAFFGDSFTENLRLPAHHAFTEVLDHLLNGTAESLPASADDPLPPPLLPPPLPPDIAEDFGTRGRHGDFNVLNFGIDGTGPAEQHSLWRGLAVKQHLRHVFYVHMENDVANTRRTVRRGLADARLAGMWQVPIGIRALSRLHLTYLALDVWRRLDMESAQSLNFTRYAKALPAFESILRRWRREVEAGGGAFHVVLLPTPEGDRWFRRLESLSSWRTADLPRCFHEAIPDFDYADWRFVNDGHWNEAANMVAAHCLYRHLEGVLGLPERSDLALAQALHAYYRAFLDHARFGGEAAWTPGPPWALPGPLADGEADRIVARYQALGQ